MKRKVLPILSIIILAFAAIAALYPTVSAWINDLAAKGEITRYNDTVDSLAEDDKTRMLLQAENYNSRIRNNVKDSFSPSSFVNSSEYLETLNLTEVGQLGTVDIPCIKCSLPIYHGIDEDMLSKGAVHLFGTSLPIGGESTHSVISAHTAYPGKILFDRLTDMEIGDTFSVTVLGNTLYYQVIDINVVLPTEIESLEIKEGKDMVTLMTCTPHSVNTHRLLVTGERFYPEPDEQTIEEPQSSVGISVYITLVFFAAVPLSAIILKVRKREK